MKDARFGSLEKKDIRRRYNNPPKSFCGAARSTMGDAKLGNQASHILFLTYTYSSKTAHPGNAAVGAMLRAG